MTTFDKREDEFEKAFVHDAEMRFKVDSKRNRALGLWAAEKLGLNTANADSYADELVSLGASSGDRDEVFDRLRADFDAAGIDLSDHQIQREMEDRTAAARKELMAQG
ncbi:MAG: DUF1476 domain-containing protein [Alphaproteobacteria bacterium]